MNKSKIIDIQIEAFDQCKKFEDGLVKTDEVFYRFAELLLEEVMQTLMINGHTDACDTLNNYFGDTE